MRIRTKPAYSFDDVLLVPQHSKIASRQDVDLSTNLGKMKLTLPIISANMDTVTEARMAIAMGRAGGAGVLHRFASIEEQHDWIRDIYGANHPIIVSVGADSNQARLLLRPAVNDYINTVCVDVAHGDHEKVLDIISCIRAIHPDLDIIAGNVTTSVAAERLVQAGANIIKVGIGPGSVCSTRIVSGHGMPQLSAIMEVRAWISALNSPAHIIADGGIRYPGDIVKALAAGADAVMLGSLLAGTDEAAGERIVEHGATYKTFRGMASREAQQKKSDKTPRVEGVTAKVPYRGPVADTLDNLEAGIRSGFSYSGANNLDELRDSAEFVVVTGNTLKESHPHHPYRL